MEISEIFCEKSLLSRRIQFSVMAASKSIYDFNAVDIDGNDIKLSDYAGKVCIIVNVASKWGKTPVNYKQLVALQNKYAEADSLRILAFPCNQFGSQEPGTDAEVKAFADAKGVDATKGFIMFGKIDVNGCNTHPLWTFLKDRKGGMLGNFIKWNFTKFVVDKEGQPQVRFGPTDDPIPKVENEVVKLF
jgi:glutathione peroxidase-family protein